MFIRFVTADIDADSNRETGTFQAAQALLDAGTLYGYEEELVREILNWFRTYLKVPIRFTASKPPYYRKKNKAISWFKSTATEHIAKMREIVAILENHGVAVRTITCSRVGYIVYEDKYQIVAEPFADSLP